VSHICKKKRFGFWEVSIGLEDPLDYGKKTVLGGERVTKDHHSKVEH